MRNGPPSSLCNLQSPFLNLDSLTFRRSCCRDHCSCRLLPQTAGGRQSPDRGPAPPLFTLVLDRGRRRSAQADAPLRRPDQRLLASAFALPALAFALQAGHAARTVMASSSRLEFASDHQRRQRPVLQQVVATRRDAQGLGGLGGCADAGQHLQNHGRTLLGLAAAGQRQLVQLLAAGLMPGTLCHRQPVSWLQAQLPWPMVPSMSKGTHASPPGPSSNASPSSPGSSEASMPSSSGEVPGRPVQGWSTQPSGVCTTPAGPTGSGQGVSVSAGARGTRSTTSPPPPPERMTRSPSAWTLNG